MPELSTLTEEQLRRIEANKARALEKLKAKRQARELEEKKEERPLKRARWIKSYYEYDLSKMIDSKGGFIVEEDKIKEEKKNRYVPEPYYPSFDSSETPKCKECGTIDLDSVFFNVFHLNLCSICKEKFPEKYSLITKTEAKEDYLLTDPELKDTELLPHWSKPNPHKSTWNDMMLYVREMVTIKKKCFS
jgi:DNA-repair protein complementing XP-A cells